jgi:membrane-bound lytic murein transglycosylase D
MPTPPLVLAFLLVCALLHPAAPVNAQEAFESGLNPSTTSLGNAHRDIGGPAADAAAASHQGLRLTPRSVTEIHDTLGRVPTIDLTYDAADLWDRIRRGFAMPDLDTPEVTDQQAFYLNRPAYLRRVFERGRRYLYYIVGELERRGMPTELALLPMVESAFNPMAYSRAHASGLWQFIPSTGRYYNLAQNSWVDERRDVIASTNAALDYLQTIYEMHGDWQLALASYNWGEGAVGRALEKNEAAGLPTEYAALRMPAETRNYVPKLQALKNIVARPELFDIDLPYVANRPYFTTVESPAALDMATAARLADIPLEEFIALNPGYRKPVIPLGSQPIVVPADKEARFRANIEQFPLDQPRWRTYLVQRGDRLDVVAAHFGISARQLAAINALPASARLAPGKALLVPAGGNVQDALDAAKMIPDPLPSKAGKRKAKRSRHSTKKKRRRTSAKKTTRSTK